MKYFSLIVQLAFIVAIVVAILVLPAGAFAASEASSSSFEAGSSAIPATRIVTVDTRSQRLKTYLASHNSPLTPYAGVFVEKADQYELDWKLVASIAGVESTFGKQIPSSSYNAYGWNGGNFYFKNWEDGIGTVSKTLREKYMDKWGADTVWEIAPYYAPPSTTWAYKVNYFMEQIERGPKTRSATLALKLTI